MTLGTGRTTLGRDPKNDLVLDNDAVSSEHASIEVRNGRYWLEDLRSTNGTRIGGTRLDSGKPVQLKGGDHIRFGEIDLMFALVGYVPGGATVFLDSTTSEGELANARAVLSSDESRNESSVPESNSSRGRSHISLLPSVEDEGTPYRSCIDFHLARVEEISPALSDFVERAFDSEMRAALAIAGSELIEAAHETGSLQHKAYTTNRIRYLTCAVPVPLDQAREPFRRACGGFTRLLTGALQEESFHRERCEILVVFTFGQSAETDARPWVSLSVVPDEGQDPRIDLLSYELLTDEERHEIDPDEAEDQEHSTRS